VLGRAHAAGIGVVCRSVLLRGALSRRYVLLPTALADLHAAIEELTAIVGSVEALPDAAYRYVLADQRVASALVGTARIDELEVAVQAATAGPLDDTTVRQVRGVAVHDARLLQPALWPPDSGGPPGPMD
jgi:aryl-alcohol dehydrogenase-like predicted oxidoreductase